MDGAVGKNKAIIKKKDLPLLLAQRVAAVKSKNKVFQDFINAIIKSDLFLYYCEQIKTGTTISHISKSQIEEFIIPYPPLPEQKAIAKILSDLDLKIELNQQMNKTLEEIGKTLLKRWFVDFEFSNDEGKPYKSSGGEMVYNEELKKEIPKGWKVDKLKNQLMVLESGNRPKGGASLSNTGVPSIGAENIKGLGWYDYSSTKYVPQDYFNNMKQGIVLNEDVLLYKDGAQLGRKTMFMNNFPYEKCCINEHVFILRSNKKEIENSYLYFWLDQEFMTDKIITLNTNSAQPGITKAGVNSLPILIPNKEIINKFQKITYTILSKLYDNCNENKTLTDARDLLLPKLMSGKIRAKYG